MTTGSIVIVATETDDIRAVIVAVTTGREGTAPTQPAIGGTAGASGVSVIGVRDDGIGVETAAEIDLGIVDPSARIVTTVIANARTAPGAIDRLPSSTSDHWASHLSQRPTTSMFLLLACYVELTAITTQYDVGAVPSVADS